MWKWAAHHVFWFITRVVITLAGVFTIQNLIHREGYSIDFHILLVGAICLIVCVRLWMPSK